MSTIKKVRLARQKNNIKGIKKYKKISVQKPEIH